MTASWGLLMEVKTRKDCLFGGSDLSASEGRAAFGE